MRKVDGRGNRWLTAAGVLLLIQGVMGIAYPILMTAPGEYSAWTFILVGFGVVNLAAAIGVLRGDAWARVLAAGLAGAALLLLYGPSLAGVVTDGDPTTDDWFGLASYVVILVAVLFGWPRAPISPLRTRRDLAGPRPPVDTP